MHHCRSAQLMLELSSKLVRWTEMVLFKQNYFKKQDVFKILMSILVHCFVVEKLSFMDL